ncbi:MAG: GntR family transcriptional regulator [Acidimicrobiia bacterium]|nr:GntR family transcriptional regulator [Acidimicrobiia bacterium]MDH4307544.1 GntR family transcriptional regulator [Acidimicrobiia bacterium]
MRREFARTAGQTAAQLLREQILSGALPPGATLNQNDLASAMGMSRIPIRDALRSLAAEGLVEMRAHATASVSPLSLDDLAELYDLRLALEPALCARALPDLTSADFAEMEETLEQLEAAEDSDEWLDLNNRFHEVLFRRSKRPRTIEIIKRARLATGRYTRIYHQFDLATVEVEHRLILEAARAGQDRRLAALITAHLSDGYETMIRYVAAQEGFSDTESDDSRALIMGDGDT